MKKVIFLFGALFALTFALTQVPAAYAQEECRDAAGAVIPCPPTEKPHTEEPNNNGGGSGGSDSRDGGSSNDNDSGGGKNPSGGNPNPPTVVTATPSPTPSPTPTSTVKDKLTENPTKNAPLQITPTPTDPPVIVSGDDAMPTELVLAPGFPWGPVGITGLVVFLVALLLPAVQKVREAAARSEQTKEHVLLNKEDPQEAKKIFLGGLSAQPEKPVPQTREHILLANQGDETSAESLSFGAIEGTTNEDGIGREDIIKREDKDKG